MNGESYDLLRDIIQMLNTWEKDYRNIPAELRINMNRFSAYILKKTGLNPPLNLRDFLIFLKTNTLKDMGFKPGAEYEECRIINDDGFVEYEMVDWVERFKEKDDIDQALMRDFLIACRAEYRENNDPNICDMYTDIRSFINKNNYCIRADKLAKLIRRYSSLSKAVFKIKSFYEDLDTKQDIVYCCPVCGKILSHDLLKENRCTDMCMFYRERDSLDVIEKKLDQNLKYKKLKRGLHIFTLIPAVSEFRMYEELTGEFGENNVVLYPDIDRFDILIRSDEIKIWLDVKDFKYPQELVEKLVETNAFKKMSIDTEKEYVFLVIPEHRKYLFVNGDYKKKVKEKIKGYSGSIRVIYESEVIKEVGGIMDEI